MANRSPAEILQEHGIALQSYDLGRHYTTCPQCSASRSTSHRGNKVLGVTIDSKGVQWGCNHCSWTGGAYYNGKANGRDRSDIIARYDYVDENGELLFQVCRKADKSSFPQRRPDGKGGWRWETKSVRKVLYRLPELLAAVSNNQPIVIPEGEKDVNNLWRIGLAATCNPGGAPKPTSARPNPTPKWKPEYSETLRGADVLLTPDNDPAGWLHVNQIAAALNGIAARIRILRLPNLPEKGDVSDWLAAGGTREQLDALIEQAPDWVPMESSTADGDGKAAAEASEQELINELARLKREDPLAYDQRRTQAARNLGIRRSTLDNLVNGQDAQACPLPEIEPWPEAVDGADVLQQAVEAIGRHVVLREDQALTCALWIMHTYCFDAFDHTPRLQVKSPVMRCGKSTLMSVVGKLANKSLNTENITMPALFRAIAAWEPTLLIDEADSFLLGYNGETRDDLRGILNAGHARGGCVIRTVGDDHTPTTFDVFGPIAYAWLVRRGKMVADTLSDRSITIELRRRLPGEEIARFRSRKAEHLYDLARKLNRWITDNRLKLLDSDPQLPEEINDRAQDNWRPLCAIADTISENFGQRAREAAVAITAEHLSQVEDDAGVEALADMAALFTDRGSPPFILSEKVIEALVALPDRPWKSWRNGLPISARGLAVLLRAFSVMPQKFRPSRSEKTVRAYMREHVVEAAKRFAPRGASEQTMLPLDNTDEPQPEIGDSSEDGDDVPF
jgi:hypothetical protein